MTTKRVEIRTVDNGFVVIWDDNTRSHEEIFDGLASLRTKLVELYA